MGCLFATLYVKNCALPRPKLKSQIVHLCVQQEPVSIIHLHEVTAALYHQSSITFTRASLCCTSKYTTSPNITTFLFCRAMAANCKLRLVQFCETSGGKCRVGVEQGNGGSVVDITTIDPSIPSDMKSFIQSWDINTAAAAKSVVLHLTCIYDTSD